MEVLMLMYGIWVHVLRMVGRELLDCQLQKIIKPFKVGGGWSRCAQSPAWSSHSPREVVAMYGMPAFDDPLGTIAPFQCIEVGSPTQVMRAPAKHQASSMLRRLCTWCKCSVATCPH
eukprot:scaffold22967_cov33-Tisochrysis_lutea.AAC.1